MIISQLNILLVDDMGFYKSIIHSCVSQLKIPYELTYAQSVKEAMEKLDELYKTDKKINLIISDLVMPEKSGTEMIKMIRLSKNYRDLPFILITAEADKDKLLDALQTGLDSFLLKPFDALQLREAINQSFINRGVTYKPKE